MLPRARPPSRNGQALTLKSPPSDRRPRKHGACGRARPATTAPRGGATQRHRRPSEALRPGSNRLAPHTLPLAAQPEAHSGQPGAHQPGSRSLSALANAGGSTTGARAAGHPKSATWPNFSPSAAAETHDCPRCCSAVVNEVVDCHALVHSVSRFQTAGAKGHCRNAEPRIGGSIVP